MDCGCVIIIVICPHLNKEVSFCPPGVVGLLVMMTLTNVGRRRNSSAMKVHTGRHLSVGYLNNGCSKVHAREVIMDMANGEGRFQVLEK